MSIKAGLAKGGMWMAIASAMANLSGMVVFVLMARMLQPAQFGIVAFATLFTDLGMVFINAGIPDWLIQRKEWDQETASTAFWTNMLISALLVAAMAGLVLTTDNLYHDPIFNKVLGTLSVVLLIDAASSVHIAKLRRDFRYRDIAMRQVAANLLMGVSSIILAFTGFGVWALVWSRVLYSVVNSTVLWMAADWHPRFYWKPGIVRSFLPFSLHTLGSQLLNRGSTYLLGFVIGGMLGPAMLAQWRVGSRALRIMVQILIDPFQNVAVSAFSRVKNKGDEISGAYLRVTRVCSLLICPIFLGAAATGPDFVSFVFGPQWGVAGLTMSALALVAAPMTITNFAGAAFAAAGKPRLTFLSSLAAFAGNVALTLIMFPYGVAAIAFSHTARAHVTLPWSLNLLKRGVGVRPWAVVRGILPAYSAAAVMAGAIVAARFTIFASLSPLIRLPISVACGAVIYAALLLLIDRKLVMASWQEMVPVLGKRFHFLKRFMPMEKPA